METSYTSVTPNCPTLVMRRPVLYYIQLDDQNADWQATNRTNISRPSSLAAWPRASTKNVIEKESQP